jgi:protein-tyrosine phosphatase
MNSHPYDELTIENGAKFIFTPCPGTKEASLIDSVSTLKQAGTDLLISLMFDEEMIKNTAQTLPDICAEHAITWLQMPIIDDQAPGEEFESRWEEHKEQILTLVKNKGTIAVHCKGGSGRTGLVIGLILLAYGWPADKIISEVQKLRPKALKYPLQLDYFNSYL